MNKNNTGVFRNCKTCNKLFYIRKCKIKTQFYCSAICLYKSRKGKGFNGIPKPAGYGKDNPNWQGGELLKCIYCNKEFWSIPSKIKKGRRFCGSKCFALYYRKEISQRFQKEKNPMWKGGISEYYHSEYGMKEWETNRKLVLKRDNNKCVKCSNNQNLDVHHIIPWRISKNNSLNNLMTLCRSCHNKTEPKYEKKQLSMIFL